MRAEIRAYLRCAVDCVAMALLAAGIASFVLYVLAYLARPVVAVTVL